MNHPSTSMQTTISDQQRGEKDTRLHGRQLFLARALWGIVAIFELGVFVGGLFGNVPQLQIICTSSCTSQQLSAAAVKTLQHIGLSLGDYVAFSLSVIIISTFLSFAIAPLLVCPKPDTSIPLL